MTHRLSPNRFYSLDVLRGVAAFSVVFWHWQHFFSPLNKQGVLFSIEKQPLFDALFIFYYRGNAAVQLFFVLSGFIFFWLYSKRVAERTITLRSFAVLRLSRLYPLHFVSLIFVAVGQAAYTRITNTYFVYPFNDGYHFLLNLFFASSWGFEKGNAFNAPIWSVSVEVLVYAIFFAFCRFFPRNIIILIFAVIIGLYLSSTLNSAIAGGFTLFFIGGLSFIAYEKIIKTDYALNISVYLPIITTILWLTIIETLNPAHRFTFAGLHWIIQKTDVNPIYFLYPMTIISLALIETRRGTLGKRLSYIGDISYSMYLLHFPLQLVVATVTARLAIDQALFYSPWFMASFFFALILASFASHRLFEVPMQRFLRRQSNPVIIQAAI
ncbi:MAG: acyltransferase [Methylococcaceae bacterium]|nr:acyltransferase [Methylococcaceae bacterium]